MLVPWGACPFLLSSLIFRGVIPSSSCEFVKKVWQNIGQMLQNLAFGNARFFFFWGGGGCLKRYGCLDKILIFHKGKAAGFRKLMSAKSPHPAVPV